MASGQETTVETQIEMNDSGNQIIAIEEEMKCEEEEKGLHFFVVAIKRANISNFCCKKPEKECDAFVRITFDDDTGNAMETGKRYKTQGIPRWNFMKRFVFKKKEEIPKQIKFTIFDYEYYGDNKEIGFYIFDVEKQGLDFFYETVDLDTNGTITISVSYKNTTFKALMSMMKQQRKHCMAETIKLSKESIEWIDKNKELFLLLKENRSNAVQITYSDFGDMIYPSFQLIRDDHKLFLSEYALLRQYLYELDENGDGFQVYYDKERDVLYYDKLKNINFGGQNVTDQVKIMWRYIFLKDVLLKGQDAEFNIYRSYYFDENDKKVAMALLSLVIQIILTVAITYDVIDRFEETVINGELDSFIIICSVFVFCFISFTTNVTVTLFIRFYKNVWLVYDLPWFLLFCDFMSNVVIAIFITILSLFFLMQSESYSDLVLNSFALTFLFEIDDMINIFDSDEDYVIVQDLRLFANTDYKSPRKIKIKAQYFFRFLLSPFLILETIALGFGVLCSLFFCRTHKRKR